MHIRTKAKNLVSMWSALGYSTGHLGQVYISLIIKGVMLIYMSHGYDFRCVAIKKDENLLCPDLRSLSVGDPTGTPVSWY